MNAAVIAVERDDFLCDPSNITVNLTSLSTITMHFCHVGYRHLVLAASPAACGVYLSVAEGVVISRQTAYTPHCGMGGTCCVKTPHKQNRQLDIMLHSDAQTCVTEVRLQRHQAKVSMRSSYITKY